jgi:hypothetical protein
VLDRWPAELRRIVGTPEIRRSGTAGDIQAGRQRSIRDNASAPNGTNEVVFADDALPVPNQVIEQVKNLRCDRHRIRPPMQFAPFRLDWRPEPPQALFRATARLHRFRMTQRAG